MGLAVFACALPASDAQELHPPKVDPRYFGFDFPAGELRPGDHRRVLTNDDEGNPVVAKLHVEVGGHRVVMLPDGKLVARRAADAEDSDRPFEPISKEDIAAKLTAGTFKGFRTHETPRYLFVYNTSDTFTLVASRILDTMFPGVERYARAQKIDLHKPDVPLVVIMFRTEAEFQRYRRMPPGVIAYYDPLTNHVVLYEESRLARVKPELAIQQALSTIAHEGAHQILHNIGVQQRLSVWPMWLSEGMAEFFAPTTTGKRLEWKGAGNVNDMRMFELERYLKLQANDGYDGKTIEQTVLAARLSSTGYASAWSLTHYLAKRKRLDFHRFVNRMSQLGPLEGYTQAEGPGFIAENLRLFKENFGDDLADMERLLVAHLQQQDYTPPFADEPHFVAMIVYPNGRKPGRDASLFFSAEHAERWRDDVLGKLSAEQRDGAKSAIQECPNRARANLLLQQFLSGK